MSIEEILRSNLVRTLEPSILEIVNESYMHSVPANSETHFRIVVVSDLFKAKSLVNRHKLTYKASQPALDAGMHALAIQCFTQEEWEENPDKNRSPDCRGGAAP